jgi:hypothetical protein
MPYSPLHDCFNGVYAPDSPFGPWLDDMGRLPREHPMSRVDFEEGRSEAAAYRSWMRMYNAITGGRVYCDGCMETAIMPKDCGVCLYGLEMSNQSDFETAMSYVCFDNLIDYYIIYYHFDNWDWPGNNFITYKIDVINPDIPAADGKWRFITHDFDGAFGNADRNGMNMFTTPGTGRAAGTGNTPTNQIGLFHDNQPYWAVKIWRCLFENEVFRNTLAARYSTYTGTAFHPARANQLIDVLVAERRNDIGASFFRWNKHGGDLDGSVTNWLNSVNHLRTFTRNRATHALNHIRQYYNRTDRPHLNAGIPSGTCNIRWSADTTQGFLDISGAQIRPDLFAHDGRLAFNINQFEAEYLRGLPITVTAVPLEGYRFSHFEVTGAITQTVGHHTYTFTPAADARSIQVRAVFTAG